MHTAELRDLGLAFGRLHNRTVTTFDDAGIPEPSQLRAAYQHIMPTTLGFLAGATKLLRDPWVVHALKVALTQSGRPLFEHLVSILNANLAAVYGDERTLRALTEYMQEVHRRKFPAAGLPDWFVATTGEARDFRPYDEPLMRAVTMTIAAAISRAHLQCGLITPGDMGVGYGQDLIGTIGRIAGLPFPQAPLTTKSLEQADIGRQLPLMSNAQLRAAKVPDLLASVLESEIDNQTIGDLAQLFVGFMDPDDREALDLTWTDDDQFKLDAWTGDYSIRAKSGALPIDGFFAVSRRKNRQQ